MNGDHHHSPPRSKLLLEEALGSMRSGGGLSRRRKLTGLVLAVSGLPLLTLLLRSTSSLSLEGHVLIYLLGVVVVAVVGGIVIAVLAAVAGTELDKHETLRELLEHALRTFDMQTVAFMARDRGSREWYDVERVGSPSPEAGPEARFDVPAGDGRLVGYGPAIFPEDPRVLQAFAAAAHTAHEGRQLTEQAEEGRTLAVVDRQRTSLLAAVGHDLRTPLAAIKAAVGTLRQTDIDLSLQDREELMATIEQSADRLDGVVANLLDASRLQAGAFSVRAQPVALDEVVAAAILALPRSDSRVDIQVPENLPLVLADPGLLERVVVNLLDNALRYGGSATPVEVRAFPGSEAVRLEVIDHGPGVPAEERERLFEPFRRVNDRSGSGIGLGLSVARGFTEAMGGALVADKSVGGGLVMRLRLPLAPIPRQAAASIETPR